MRRSHRAASSPEYQDIAVSSIRKTIAERMLESKQTTAAVTITTTVDATNLVNLRRQFKAVAGTGETPADRLHRNLVKLTALALEKHPMLNSRWNGDQIQVWRSIHIGIAVDTEAGLMVPVIRDVPRLSLRELAALLARPRRACPHRKTHRLRALGKHVHRQQPGTVGSRDVHSFDQPARMRHTGFGSNPEPVVVENKQFVERDRMVLSLTFDHRIVDGAPAARFLQTLGLVDRKPQPLAVVLIDRLGDQRYALRIIRNGEPGHRRRLAVSARRSPIVWPRTAALVIYTDVDAAGARAAAARARGAQSRCAST